ncbi:MAG: nucleoside deaminase [Alphaproteobacteria bacterium]|jgi:tRNA(Arg) A34 adenosine deaminase TadA|nr:nucleoside deaminase [Alphaproteobacteria bacterium]MDP7222260.1 nucleoside deaminase [Alphaproteobacteria bacterium]
MISDDDYNYMQLALEEAKKAFARDEVPIGAVIVDPQRGDVVAAAGNRTREYNDPTAHAEVLAIRAACEKQGAQRIPDLDLYVTLEPCAMCAGAISFARIRRLVIGAGDAKGGGVLHGGRFYDQKTCHHRPDVAHDVLADDCGQILKEFFKQKRG